MANCGLFCAINSALHFAIFASLSLPGFVLSTLFVVALLKAKDINWKMRVILLNSLVPEFFSLFESAIDGVGYYLRATGSDSLNHTCELGIGTIGYLGNVTSLPFFSICVFIFVRYDEKKVKWLGVGAYIAVSWVVNSAFGLYLLVHDLLNTEGLQSEHGFCVYLLSQSESNTRTAFLISCVVVVLVLCLCTTLVFSILSYCYVKRNTISADLETPSPMEKACSKILQFEVVKAVMLLLQFVIPVAIAVLGYFLEFSSIIQLTFIAYFRKVLILSVSLISPIVSIGFLKPIRQAIEQMCKACFCCCKEKSQVPPASLNNRNLNS